MARSLTAEDAASVSGSGVMTTASPRTRDVAGRAIMTGVTRTCRQLESRAMPQNDPCPRCSSTRLAVMYFDAQGKPIGGHLHCPDCGPRHTEELPRSEKDSSVRTDLLKRKAS